MEREGKPSSENNPQVQAPKRDEAPVVPQLQSTSGESVSPPQQEISTEVFLAQSPAQEHETQTNDRNPVVLRKGGSRQKPLEYTRDGELYVGSLIRELREEKGLSMKEAAARVGYGISGLSQIETNHAVPSEEKLLKIAELLDVPVADLKQAPEHPRIWRTPIEKLKKMSFGELAKHESRLRPKPRFRRLP
jgi:transcriptional regulator with XRE-family HTH domain